MTDIQKKQLLDWVKIVIDKFQVDTPLYKTSSGQQMVYLVDISPKRLDPHGYTPACDKIPKLTIARSYQRIYIRYSHDCDVCEDDIYTCYLAVNIQLGPDGPSWIDIYDSRHNTKGTGMCGQVWFKSKSGIDKWTYEFQTTYSLLTFILEPIVQATEFEMSGYEQNHA